jgi:integrase
MEIRSPNASNKDRKNLIAMWGKGAKTWGIRNNPVSGSEKYPHDRASQYTPPNDDVAKVLLAASRKDQAILLAYIQTGARRSELFRWTWIEDIDFDKQRYRLGTRKTRDGSLVHEWFPMSEDLGKELRWLFDTRKFQQSPFVFVDDQPGPHYGNPYKARRRFMHGLCKRAGVKPFGFHALRRFCASCLADAGKSTNSIRRFLRHSNVRTTEIYIQNINDDLKDVADALSISKLFPVPEDGTRTKKQGATD